MPNQLFSCSADLMLPLVGFCWIVPLFFIVDCLTLAFIFSHPLYFWFICGKLKYLYLSSYFLLIFVFRLYKNVTIYYVNISNYFFLAFSSSLMFCVIIILGKLAQSRGYTIQLLSFDLIAIVYMGFISTSFWYKDLKSQRMYSCKFVIEKWKKEKKKKNLRWEWD